MPKLCLGVSSSPFLLNATVKHRVEGYKEKELEFVEIFLRSIYVDDLSSGGDTDEEAYELYMKSIVRLVEGGFNLRQFVTNSPESRKQIEDNENGLWKISGASPTGEDMYDSGILQDVLVSDRATVELVVR